MPDLTPMKLTCFGLFKPDYSPQRMMRLGVFGGNYFANAKRMDFRHMSDGITELAKLNTKPYSLQANCFGVRAGLSFDEWQERGWLFPEDPLGWFHWYCRYYSGRRHHRDAHQIDRWQRYRQRWGDRAHSQYTNNGCISPVVMQGLLQWSIDPYVGFNGS